MNISELEFEAKEYGGGQARINFPNGYGASVITGKGAYTSEGHPYELAVLHNGSLCYESPITSDVLGHLTTEDVERHLDEIKSLPKLDE